MTTETQKQADGSEVTADADTATDIENAGGGLGGQDTEVEAGAEADANDTADTDTGATGPLEASGEDGEPEPGEGESDEEAAEASKPDSPDGFEINVAEDIEWPGGMQVEIDLDNDTTKAMREIAFEEGLSQKALDRLVDLHMREMASNLGQIGELLNTNQQAEIEKIGSERIATVDAALRSHLGKETADKLFPVLSTAASYEAMEKIVDRLNSAPGGNRKSNGGEQPAGERLKGTELLEHAFSKGSS